MVPGCLLITLLGRGWTPFGGGPELDNDMPIDTFPSPHGSAARTHKHQFSQESVKAYVGF
jgi:hypothetical protein